ncbi:hypothetical protein CGCSCA1_v014844 [Colletotrichum siamense]|nr:hypothetical protein CGCSCA1_v014844 [Colletotrichum siamense]
MSVTHIVMFQFGRNASNSDIQSACRNMLALKEQCLHPVTRQPYIKSVSGGEDNSPEGNQGGITHAFVVEFASVEDRDYYVKTDATHQRFVASLAGLVAKSQVIDYTPNVF